MSHSLKKAKNRRTSNLRQVFDVLTNIGWPLSHYKSAARYLQGDPDLIAATGGTNWQKYLPPRHQRIIFFPDLFTEQEKGDWGKISMMRLVLDKD